jgi:hypothetical protein
MRVKLFFAVLILFSCKQKEKKNFSINQPTKATATLKSSIINKGDTAAYYELFNKYVDESNESADFFYYSYVMAFKYNYPKAYVDVFFILCKIYNIDTNAYKIDLSKMDLESKRLALESMKHVSQLNYLDSKKIYESILDRNEQ